MIACQDETQAAHARQPADRFRALSGLVDDGQVELALTQDFAVETRQGRANRTVGPVQDTLDGLRLQPTCVRQERPEPPGEAAWRVPGAGLARVSFAGLPKQGERLLGQLTRLTSYRRGLRPSGRGYARAAPARPWRDGRAGPPCSPCASRRSSRLSTAKLLGAQASTLCPRRTAWRISSTTAVGLAGARWSVQNSQVRGGQGETNASCWEAFRDSSRGTTGVSGRKARGFRRVERREVARDDPVPPLFRPRHAPKPSIAFAGLFHPWKGQADSSPNAPLRWRLIQSHSQVPCGCARTRRLAIPLYLGAPRPTGGWAILVPVDSTAAARCGYGWRASR